MQCYVITLTPSLIRPPQYRGIVSADLGTSGTIRGSAIEVVENQAAHRVDTMVHTGRQDIDTKGILLRRGEAELGAGTIHLRANVHGGTGVVWRHPLCVEGDGGTTGIYKHIDRHGGHGDKLGTVLHANGVAIGSKDLNRAIAGCSESFETFVGLLAVVEGGSHAMYADVGVGDKLEGCPFAGLVGVVGLDMAVNCKKRWVS